MKKLIEDFSSHLREALTIGLAAQLNPSDKTFDNVLVCGLGGSGIGGSIVTQVVGKNVSIPLIVNKDYHAPGFIKARTLVVLCSYSGNTEETIMMLDEVKNSGAEIACITSGGKLAEVAKQEGYNCIFIPDGMPPRAAFGYSFPQLFFMLHHYGILDNSFTAIIKSAAQLLDNEEQSMQQEAKQLAKQLHGKIPILYSDAWYEGVAIRFRQQINENAKMLCWHHCIPEMNHNELVGWKQKNEQLAVVILRNTSDFYRTQKRMDINKAVFSQYTSHIYELFSKGENELERSLYLIHLGDWVSYFLAEIQGIDAVEVNVITHLKGELSKI
jgi:glucose/mannose-6-phosphate isomerase